MKFNLKKSIAMAIAAGFAACSFAMPVYAAAEDADTSTVAVEEAAATTESDAAEAAPAETSSTGEAAMSPEELLDYYKNSGYKYTSKRYGYSIICPVKPNVVPLSQIYADDSAHGAVLIFANEEYNIKNAWVIMVDAFDDKMIPEDLDKKPEKDQQKYLDDFAKVHPVEFARITNVAGNAGLYTVTAKAFDVDTDGDGKIDDTVTADTQEVRTYFRGQYGGHFLVGLIDNPELTKQDVGVYELGLLTFQEWPSEMDDKGKTKDKK